MTVTAITDALQRDDVDAVRTFLRAAAVASGPKAFVTELAHPLAVRIGELWQAGTIDVRHEHVATACLSTTLHLLLGAHEDGARASLVLLATLPGEPHALALDMIAVYLAASLAAPRLLGADTPPEQIIAAAEAFSADAVGISISPTADVRAAQKGVRAITRALPPGVPLWIGGGGASRIDAESARIIGSWVELDAALADVRRQPAERRARQSTGRSKKPSL